VNVHTFCCRNINVFDYEEGGGVVLQTPLRMFLPNIYGITVKFTLEQATKAQRVE
jgi:hypothetical protein